MPGWVKTEYAMTSRLKPLPFSNSLSCRPSEKEQPRKRVRWYIVIKDIIIQKKDNVKKSILIMIEKSRRKIGRRKDKRKEELTNITSLMERHMRIFWDVYYSTLINLPCQKESKHGANRSTCCGYYKIHGHSTNNCQRLKV